MNRASSTIAAIAFALSLSVVGVSHANTKPNPVTPTPTDPKKTITEGNEKSIKAGTTNFRERNFRNWRSYCYYPAYRCYLFYDRAARQWFFWNERLGRFLPLALIATSPPTTSGAALLPPGAVATPLPTGTAPPAVTNSGTGDTGNQADANTKGPRGNRKKTNPPDDTPPAPTDS
jgi:hypothetical protein